MDSSNAHYYFDRFRLDTDRRLLTDTEGHVIDLTPKAIEILCVLVERNGELVQKDELMKLVWPDSFVEEANLSHHIFKLRQSIGDNLIETVPKRGYRFVGNLNHDDQSSTVAQAVKTELPRWVLIAGIVTGLVIISASVWFFAVRPSTPTPQATAAKTPRTIAVLPFVNESGNDEIEYLADGMTETLIASLTKIKTLNVKSRASVFRYKGQDISPTALGSELNVEAALFGRLTRRGETVTLFLSLVDTKTDYQIWGKQFVRGMSELAAFQNEIGREVANNLEAELSGEDELLLSRNYSKNAEAYRLYLLGNYYWARFTEENFRKAIEQFEKAIAIDPNYALAHVGIANSYSVLGVNGHIPVVEARVKSKEPCDRALQLDSGLAEAHNCDGAYKMFFGWDLPGAEAAFRRAIELDPTLPFPHELLAYVLRSQQRFDEAIEQAKKAREVDPLNLLVIGDIGTCYRFAGRQPEAIATLKQVLEMDPTFADAHFEISLSYSELGDHENALKHVRRGIELSGRSTKVVAGLGIVQARAGDRASALKVVDELLREAPKRYVSPQDIALIYATMGDRENAFQWLEKAYVEQSPWMFELNVDPAFASIRDDVRFADLARRLGISQN